MVGILSLLPGGTLPNALHYSAGRGMRPNVQMRAAQGPRARGGMADARARPCWGVAGAYRSKQRSSLRLGRSVGRQSRPWPTQNRRHFPPWIFLNAESHRVVKTILPSAAPCCSSSDTLDVVTESLTKLYPSGLQCAVAVCAAHVERGSVRYGYM